MTLTHQNNKRGLNHSRRIAHLHTHINPRLNPGLQYHADTLVIGHFITVRSGQLLNRDLKHHPRNRRAVLVARTKDRMVRLAAGGLHLGIGNFHPRLLVPQHRVGTAGQLTSEVGQLHGFVLQGAVGKQIHR